MNELRLVVPLIPPSGNHYKTYRVVFPKSGAHTFVQWYLTKEAEAFYEGVQAVAAGRSITGKSLDVSVIVFLPAGRRSDADNYLKCALDSLKHARVIRDDIDIDDLHCHRRRDTENPRTVFVIKSDQGELNLCAS